MHKKRYENKLTEIEKDIVTHLQYRVTKQEKISLSDLADECHVAKSTIVKTAKKLGYSGFVEMFYHMQNAYDENHANDLVYDLVEGDLKESIRLVADKIYECKDKKNLVIAKDNEDLLSHYLSRKLEMFDIFAPSTYEFNMVQNPRMKKGIAVLCDMRNSTSKKSTEMLSLIKHEGYYVIAFGDRNNKWIGQYADMCIFIHKTQYKTADFYVAKMLIFIELLLCELAARLKMPIGE